MPKGILFPRLFLFSAVIAFLLAVYMWSVGNRDHSRAFAGSEFPAVSLAWQASVPQVKHFGFSGAGNFFCLLDSNGAASVYSVSGAKRFTVQLGKANRLTVAPTGDYAMAYSHLNPVDSTLVFYDSQGKRVWDMKVEGAVWSSGVCRVAGDNRFVVGTGDRYVYVIDISAESKKYKRWRAPGVVVSMNVDPKGDYVTLGTWQSSSVTRCTLSGKKQWTANANASELQYVEQTPVSDRVIVRSLPNKTGIDGGFAVLDNRGKEVWSGKIKAAESTKILYSPNGRYVCLGYKRKISHKGETTSEQHSALFDSSGRRLWDKGSLFFHPLPLAVTSGGCVVISNERNAVFTMDRSGELDPSIKLPGPVMRSVVSPDGSKALIECSNGKFCILRISG